MKFKIGIVLAAAAFAALVTGWGSAAAQPAAADHIVAVSDVHTSSCVGPGSPDGGAAACFDPHGEHLLNCDLKSDGHHPVAHYYRSTSPNTLRTISDAPTAGNCVDHNLADIPESGWIDVQSCNYEGSTALSCSGYVRVSANG
jgi:hypothetical protein